jgi:hypothetical protein
VPHDANGDGGAARSEDQQRLRGAREAMKRAFVSPVALTRYPAIYALVTVALSVLYLLEVIGLLKPMRRSLCRGAASIWRMLRALQTQILRASPTGRRVGDAVDWAWSLWPADALPRGCLWPSSARSF